MQLGREKEEVAEVELTDFVLPSFDELLELSSHQPRSIQKRSVI